MADREKVREGLRICMSSTTSEFCAGCPYYPDMFGNGMCTTKLCADALELIDSQDAAAEKVKPDREQVLKALKCIAGLETALISECREKGCPFAETECETAVAAAALELMTPRVMTLEEVLKADGNFVWVEICSPYPNAADNWCMAYVKVCVLPGKEIIGLREDCGIGWTRSKSEYGKRGYLDGGWRCWTELPTKDTRKAAAWGED